MWELVVPWSLGWTVSLNRSRQKCCCNLLEKESWGSHGGAWGCQKRQKEAPRHIGASHLTSSRHEGDETTVVEQRDIYHSHKARDTLVKQPKSHDWRRGSIFHANALLRHDVFVSTWWLQWLLLTPLFVTRIHHTWEVICLAKLRKAKGIKYQKFISNEGLTWRQ